MKMFILQTFWILVNEPHNPKEELISIKLSHAKVYIASSSFIIEMILYSIAQL